MTKKQAFRIVALFAAAIVALSAALYALVRCSGQRKEISLGRPSPVTADRSIGANAFVDDPLSASKAVGHVREYHNLSFTTKDGKNCFSPSANGYWDFDEYYRGMAEAGIDVTPCIQGTADWLYGPGYDAETDKNKAPVPRGADASEPASYREHASVLFNYAARYGGENVSPSRLTLAEGQEAKSGLGYLTWYENFNEGNKTWEGRESYLTPYEFAAMCSADYDGHEGRLGRNYGIKAADPNARLAMGGLVGRNVIPYLSAMKFWFEYNRTDGRFVPDAINFHQYIATPAPEDSDFKARLSEVVAWRDANAPDSEVWVTEFGCTVDKYEPKTPEFFEMMAVNTVRAYLLALSAGVDRADMFMLRDTDWGVYSEVGLVTLKGAWKRKPAWYYTSALKKTLAGTRFVSADEGEVYRYTFRDGAGRTVIALWSPTAEHRAVKDYSLAVSGKKATLTTLCEGYGDGLISPLAVSNGEVVLEVSERPAFVTVWEDEAAVAAGTSRRIPVAAYAAEEPFLTELKKYFDEQEKAPLAPDMYLTEGTAFVRAHKNLASLPVSGTVDFGGRYRVTAVGVYDTYGTGTLNFYDESGARILSYGLNSYQTWKVLDLFVPVTARYVTVERTSNAEFDELCFYGYPVP